MHTCAHALTFAEAVSQAGAGWRWHGKRSQWTRLSTGMPSHKGRIQWSGFCASALGRLMLSDKTGLHQGGILSPTDCQVLCSPSAALNYLQVCVWRGAANVAVYSCWTTPLHPRWCCGDWFHQMWVQLTEHDNEMKLCNGGLLSHPVSGLIIFLTDLTLLTTGGFILSILVVFW